MSKRKATGQLTPAVTAKRHEVISADRARLFSARLKSLNQQFAEWVKNQAASCTSQLWLDGVQNYQEYVADLLEEFKDIVGEDGQISRQRDVATLVADTMFGTPVGAAAAGGSGQDKSAAPSTGGSTGRKSVTWADNSTALTPAPGAAANGTPNPNTKNAGHTPAPANFGRFDAGTPGGSEMPTPQFKLPPASADGTPADATPASQTARSMFGSGSDATPAAAGSNADAAAKTPGSTGGFAFGSGGFGTPVTAGPDAAAKGKDSSSPLLYTFGTPATSAVASAAAADKPAGSTADKGPGEGRAFTFGTPAAPGAGSSEAAADKSSTPTFGGFGAGSSSDKPADTGKDKEAGSTPGAPAFSFGATLGSGAAAGSSPAFGFDAGSDSAVAGGDSSSGAAAAAGDKSKSPVFNFGVTSSSAAAGGSSPAFAFGAPASGAAGASSSAASPGGFNFGAGSGAAATDASSSGAGAGGGTPTFAFGSTGAAAGGSSSTPPLTFGAAGSVTAAGSTPAFGAAGSTPAFGAAGSTPGYGTPGTGFSFGAGANGTPSTFNFPAPSAAAGGGGAAAASGGGDADDGEPQEEKTQVQRDERYTVLFGKTAILNMSVKNAAGKWDWQNRGKGQMSVRKDTQTGKYYITFNLDGQGKQLVMHEIRARDKLEEVPEGPAKVRMTLLNTITDVKPAGVPGGLPETVHVYERRMCIIRFGSKEVADDFKAMVEKHKPTA